MMGVQAAPERLFYDFCLEDHVPCDHLLRRIDEFLDLASVRQELRPFYSAIGRPSIDPELMIRMLIVGYCFAIRSERRLCDEVHLTLAYRWFCRLGLDGKVADHSTFSLNRNGRFRQSDILRHVFETVVRRCIAEGLVGGEGFAEDAVAKDPQGHRRRRPRRRQSALWHAGLRPIAPRAQEGRDAVRPSQAHPEDGPAAAARAYWRRRRVPPCRHRPEPQKTRQAEAETAAHSPTSLTKQENRSPDITRKPR